MDGSKAPISTVRVIIINEGVKECRSVGGKKRKKEGKKTMTIIIKIIKYNKI